MKETMLASQGVEKRFGSLEVLKGIAFSMRQGEKLVIVGPAGSGKSTIPRCINHLESFGSGQIFYKKESIEHLKPSHLRSEVEMVFQRFNVFSHMSELENLIEAPIHVKKVPRQQAIEQALDPELVGEVLQVMKKIALTGTSMIVVTHEMEFAREVADRIQFMDEGIILQDDPPEVFFSQPCNDRVRNFIAKVGFSQKN